MELALEVSVDRVELTSLICFNPCYYGIGFRSLGNSFTASSAGCFNPCYYGIGFRRVPIPSPTTTEKVSILVIMELALEAAHHDRKFYIRNVSILVIMELALEDAVTATQIADNAGFNPCYYGIGFRSATESLTGFYNSLFQSLLLWNWL